MTISVGIFLSKTTLAGNQVYFRAASGFRAQTIQDRLQDDPHSDYGRFWRPLPFEIGYKALWERVRLNAAAFYYQVDDMQLVAGRGAGQLDAFAGTQIGETGAGVEVEVEYAVTDNLIFCWFWYADTDQARRTVYCSSRSWNDYHVRSA